MKWGAHMMFQSSQVGTHQILIFPSLSSWCVEICASVCGFSRLWLVGRAPMVTAQSRTLYNLLSLSLQGCRCDVLCTVPPCCEACAFAMPLEIDRNWVCLQCKRELTAGLHTALLLGFVVRHEGQPQ